MVTKGKTTKVEATKTEKTKKVTRKPKSLVLTVANPEVQSTQCDSECKCKHEWKAKCCQFRFWMLCLKLFGIFLLLLNLLVSLVLIVKVNQLQNWTILSSWGEKNFKELQSIYYTNEYQTSFGREIADLKSRLIDYSNQQ